ncbi:MAG: glycerol-3-phosphate dehydrogenase, anaerobic, B subunit [Desulfosporosinus sp. BRH_c37]|nr:MAG: glycerol-3-phosphate dehydrogenase, anaerobic, B subunit [Desulfosporosinus sp. BRH_c37]
MWDGIIVGGGLAGLLAGIRASERGKRILIISEGVGSLTYSSGVMDFGDVEQLVNQEKHPYSLLGERAVRSGIEYFQTLFPEYQENWGASPQVLTPLGTPRKAGIVPKGLNAGALQDAQRIVLVVPEGLKDFFPEVIKSNLERSYPRSIVVLYPLRIAKFEPWHELGKSVAGMDYAKYWRSVQGIKLLNDFLDRLAQEMASEFYEANVIQGGSAIQRNAGNGKSVVVFPGLVTSFSKALEKVIAEAPFPVVELTAFPPSASGHTLYEGLKRRFRGLGGELLVGSGVKHVERHGNRCHKVIIQSKGKDTAFTSHSFILATGGIFGGGIEVTPEVVWERAFGLPLFIPTAWTSAEFLGEQPYARIGLEVDGELRPFDSQSNQVILENVRVVGRLLAHWDPWVEHCGGGVSLASGWFAGEKI